MGDTSPTNLFFPSGELPITYPMLTHTNYRVWALRMRILMRAVGVWVAIEGDGPVSREIDQDALLVISQSIPDVVIMAIYHINTAKEAWDAIKEMHIGVHGSVTTSVRLLKRQFDSMLMENSETIGEFALKLTNIVNEMRELGSPVTESTVVEKLFSSVSDRFVPIIATIQWEDVTDVTAAEAIRRLEAFEATLTERRRERGFRGGGRNKGRGRK